MNKTLITGASGFIGSALAIKLLSRGDKVVGIDNHNDYYDPKLKEDRLARHIDHKNYTHLRLDIANRKDVEALFKKYKFDNVVNLAAQAGVRYSIENPSAYVDSNLVGFGNILEGCRKSRIKHLVYASSSSVYGGNTKIPFSTMDSVNHPYSFYAATKKANELMAHSYSHLYGLPATGLRFFTVYGPWGRPDMALFKFTKAILNNDKIQIYNFGKHQRDFTYIDDIVEGCMKVLDSPAQTNKLWDGDSPSLSSSSAPWKVYNIGNSNPVELLECIECLESTIGMKALKELLPLQDGDVPNTYADVEDLAKDFSYKPSTSIQEGISKFVDWYLEYYKK
ncbi:NAD-dependent epimerase [Gammaproteobacteria bacterium]|nr:NAD-dependent epimerase [Gammaproteobacteria bacterium]